MESADPKPRTSRSRTVSRRRSRIRTIHVVRRDSCGRWRPQYGYKAALVGGVTVYGWCVPSFSKPWASRGWTPVGRSSLPPPHISRRRNDGHGDRRLRNMDADRGQKRWRNMHPRRFRLGSPPGSIHHLLVEARSRPTTERARSPTLENAPIGKDLLTSHRDFSGRSPQPRVKPLRATAAVSPGNALWLSQHYRATDDEVAFDVRLRKAVDSRQ